MVRIMHLDYDVNGSKIENWCDGHRRRGGSRWVVAGNLGRLIGLGGRFNERPQAATR